MADLSLDNWKIVQTKTFTKWVNNKLKKANYPTIENIFTDLSSGVALVNLFRALGKDVVKFNPNPFSRIQKMENLTLILGFIKDQNISLVNIGPSDIVDGDQKLILGLIWTLISKMAISDILSSEFFSIKEEILSWTQRVTESYENIGIENLTTSWQNGVGFNAIIHKFRPQLVQNFYCLDPSKAHKNCEQAFKIAEENLEIPKLFDAEDIIDVIRPDEKSILTYLSQFYQKFRGEEREMALKSHLSNMLKGIDWSIAARSAYEEKAKKFVRDKLALAEKSSSIGVLLRAVVEELKDIEKINSSLISDSVELSLLLNNIQDASKLFNLKMYYPPEDLSIDKIDISYFRMSSILNLNDLRQSVQEFENPEAQEIEKAKSISKELYSIGDRDVQFSMISVNESKFKGVYMSSRAKQEAFDKIRGCFEDKTAKLNKLSEAKKGLESLIAEAKKMFMTKDIKKTGFISVSSSRKIVRALKLDTNELIELEMQSGDLISLEKMVDTISSLYAPVMSKCQIRRLVEEVGSDGKLTLSEIVPNMVLKSLRGLAGSENELSIEAIENELDK